MKNRGVIITIIAIPLVIAAIYFGYKYSLAKKAYDKCIAYSIKEHGDKTYCEANMVDLMKMDLSMLQALASGQIS